MTNILLIEDNYIDRFIAERQLALSGLDASMQSVDNGKSGLEMVLGQFLETGFLPDVILVDYFMPIMNGLDFIQALAHADIEGKENIRVFLLTNLADPNLHLDPALQHLTGIVEKPMTSESFKRVILQASNQPRTI